MLGKEIPWLPGGTRGVNRGRQQVAQDEKCSTAGRQAAGRFGTSGLGVGRPATKDNQAPV
jgi:hypothetical protein